MIETEFLPSPSLSIGVLGTGNIARALAAHWAAHGHTIAIGGRSLSKARALASEVGHASRSGALAEAANGADVVILAVPWSSVDDVLAQIAAETGALSGVTVIDPTNPVEHGIGRHLLDAGSAAEYIAARAPGAHVVKAFNVHPAPYWASVGLDDVVTTAGDDPAALGVVHGLVRNVGATPHTLGGLDRARQIEELAGTVIALSFGGVEPRRTVPRS